MIFDYLFKVFRHLRPDFEADILKYTKKFHLFLKGETLVSPAWN